jgi:hypothetical protein
MAKKKTPAKKNSNKNRMSLISEREKQIRGKMAWTAAIKKASTQLKKEGKI